MASRREATEEIAAASLLSFTALIAVALLVALEVASVLLLPALGWAADAKARRNSNDPSVEMCGAGEEEAAKWVAMHVVADVCPMATRSLACCGKTRATLFKWRASPWAV
jgi:hypothetical protein